jgi:hypothetical protein
MGEDGAYTPAREIGTTPFGETLRCVAQKQSSAAGDERATE